MTRTSSVFSQYYAGSLVAIALVGGCIAESGTDGSELGERHKSCTYLNFDRDAAGDIIAGGDVVELAYGGIGVEIEVWDDAGKTRKGLGVAFDTDNPTGGDDDLSFSGLGNVLINQEHFDAADVANGFVSEPDDEARGALFEFRFDEPVCVESMVLLDIDFGEDPAELAFYDAADNLVATHQVAPMGNRVRIDVPLPVAACEVSRMTVLISSSGAMDDLKICDCDEPEPEIWTRIFDGGGDDVGAAVATNAARDVFVAGTTEVGAGTVGVVRRYDRGGLLTGNIAIDVGAGSDEAHGIAVDSAGDILVTGRAGGAADDDLYLRKLADDGTELWTRPFDGGGLDAGFGVAADGDDAVVVGFSEVGGGTDIVVRKYDAGGGLTWARSADIGATDIGYGVATGPGGAIAVAGQADNGSDADFWVRLYDAAGNEVWTRIFDGGGDDIARGVAIDPDGNVVVAGEAYNGANTDILVRKYDPAGNLLWSEVVDSGGADGGRGIATDAGGNVIVTGFVANATRDGFTRKLDPDGVELWTELFDAGNVDEGYGVTADIAGSVISTGFFEGDSGLDLWVAKYRP
jgi:hypothetical protein